MNHECHTNHQGRAPCTCGSLHTANSDGSDPQTADEWMGEMRTALCWVALGIVFAATVLVMARFFTFGWSAT